MFKHGLSTWRNWDASPQGSSLICSYKDFCGQAYQSQIETHIHDKQLYINVTIGELQLSRSICDSLLSPRYSVRAASTAPTQSGVGPIKYFPALLRYVNTRNRPARSVQNCIMIVLWLYYSLLLLHKLGSTAARQLYTFQSARAHVSRGHVSRLTNTATPHTCKLLFVIFVTDVK